MISTLLFDFSRVILNPEDPMYAGSLNEFHDKHQTDPGYKFFSHYLLNQQLLEFLKPLKNKYNLAIFTTGTIQEVEDVQQYIKPLFTQIFTVHELQISKKDPKSYQEIAKQLGVPVSEIFFIDDQLENVEAAKKAGCLALQYRTNAELFTTLIQIDR